LRPSAFARFSRNFWTFSPDKTISVGKMVDEDWTLVEK
jgi:hypothetical protein